MPQTKKSCKLYKTAHAAHTSKTASGMAEADDCRRAQDGTTVPPFSGISVEPCVSVQNDECENFYIHGGGVFWIDENDECENFYIHRGDVFWIDDSTHIYFGKLGYRESYPPQKDANDRTMQKMAMQLVQFSTRNVLYNLMFLSQTRLLDLSHCVLAMINTHILTDDYDNDGWEKADDLDRYRLMSVYNCIHFVIVENMGISVDDKVKKERCRMIATKIDKYGLCPCDPAKHVSTYQYEEYSCQLVDLPDDFYRNTTLKHQTQLPLASPCISKIFVRRKTQGNT